MKAHVISNGVIANTVEVDSLNALPNLVEATKGSIGWGYADGVFTPPPVPPVPVPASVTMRQARLALLGAGLLDLVETAIAAAGPAAKIEWDYATEVQSASGLVPAMATALGLTDAQIDALFVTASTL